MSPLGEPGREYAVVAAKANRRRVFRKDSIIMGTAGVCDTGAGLQQVRRFSKEKGANCLL